MRSALILPLVCAAILVSPGQGASAAPAARQASGSEQPGALEIHRRNLLDLAFRAASTVPAMPHIKTRSREQEKVLVTCLELDQPALAVTYVERIENWRRGVGYADLAYYSAKQDQEDEARSYLELARQEAEKIRSADELEQEEQDEVVVEGFQAWRKDRIRAKIARAYHALGQPDRALEFEMGLEASESGIVQQARARTMGPDDVGPVAMALDNVAEGADLEQIGNTIDVGMVLLERNYSDAVRRKLLQQSLLSAIDKTPVFFRASKNLALAEVALAQGDGAWALELARRVDGILAASLAIEDDIPIRARLATVRHRAGEAEGRALVTGALEAFDGKREGIPSLRRADVLIPIAEAYVTVGDPGAALEVYRRAARDGSENPNAVPRSEDFVALCCSMARNGVEPDSELWRQLNQTFAGLRDPW